MGTRISRVQIGAAVVTAFICGLLFASGLDLTRFGFAQEGKGSKVASSEVKSLAETGSAFEAIADHVTPSVVSIEAEHIVKTARAPRVQRLPNGGSIEDFFRNFEGQAGPPEPVQSSGTGFIVSKDGYILTNNHVVADAEKVTVHLLDKRSFTAKVIGRDSTTDVAVIKVDAKDLPVATLGDDNASRVGQWVVAIGNPLGLDFTVTAGIISAKGRPLQGLLGRNNRYAITDYIQTDAAINPGNSGGPLVNIRGEVIGINSAIASQTGMYSGYGFAIPVSLAKQVMDDLIAYGKIRRAVLGIQIGDADAEDAKAAGLATIMGVKVGTEFTPDSKGVSPAKEAGVEPADVIVAIDGKPTERTSVLQRIVRGHKPGETVTLDVMRFGTKKTFRVKLGEASDSVQPVVASNSVVPNSGNGLEERKFDKVGIAVEPVSSDVRARIDDQYRKGLLVSDVSVTGPAFRKLAADQTILLEVLNPGPRRQLHSASDLEAALSKVRPGDPISFLVYDINGSTRTVTVLAQ